MANKLRIKKGDTVMVISGEDKGKKGQVLEVIVKTNRAIVEGLNMVSKATKPSAQNTEGGIVRKEAPIHISNLMLIGPDGVPARTGKKLEEGADGKARLVRYSKPKTSKKEIK